MHDYARNLALGYLVRLALDTFSDSTGSAGAMLESFAARLGDLSETDQLQELVRALDLR